MEHCSQKEVISCSYTRRTTAAKTACISAAQIHPSPPRPGPGLVPGPPPRPWPGSKPEPQAQGRNAGAARAPLLRLAILLSCLDCLLTFDQAEWSTPSTPRRKLTSMLTLQPIGTLQRAVPRSNDFFGSSVVLSGDAYRLAIGAPSAQGRPGRYTGTVEVFEYNSGSWQQMGSTILSVRQVRRLTVQTSMSPHRCSG